MSLFSDLNSIYSIKQEIKSAIESKGVDMTNVSFPDYPAAIASISTAFVTETLSVTVNGTYYPSVGVDGFSEVSVNVPAPVPVTESLNVSVNGTYYPGLGYDGFSQVVVDVPQSVTGFTEQEITEGVQIVNLNNSASYVQQNVFQNNSYLQTVNLPNCTKVNEEAFRVCTNLISVNIPVCTNIGNSAFMTCTSLTSIDLPVCTNLGNSAFAYCSSLTSISLPVCASIANATFLSCSSLTSISLPVCETIANYAFSSCRSLNSLTLCTDVYWTIPYQTKMLSNTPIMSGTGSIYVRSDTYSAWITSTGWSSLSDRFVSVETSGIALSFSDGLVYGTTYILNSDFTNYIGISKNDILSIDLPMCKLIPSGVLSNCTSLSQVSLPLCEYVYKSAFNNCSSLKSIDLPVCSYIGAEAFRYCSSLTQVSLPVCEYIDNGAFRDGYAADYNLPVCSYIGPAAFRTYSFITITLGYSDVVSLGGDPFENFNKRVSIYVPSSLVSDYQAADYWSQYSSQIFPIPE